MKSGQILRTQNKLLFTIVPMILILIVMRNLHKSESPNQINKEEWYFAMGSEIETLHDHFNVNHLTFDTLVRIPHTVNRPNSSLWYKKELFIERDTIWQIKADDGVQLWVDGQSVKSVQCNYFYISGKAGKRTIIIRVLNNAVAGGLKQIIGLKSSKLSYIKNLSDKINLNTYPGLGSRINNTIIGSKNENSLRFSAWGDSQGGWDTFHYLTTVLAGRPSDFTIGLGDLTATGCDAGDWNQFCKGLMNLPRNLQIFLIPGNHDYDGYYDKLNAENFMEFQKASKHDQSYYFFSNNTAAFLVLDPNINFPISLDKKQLKWASEMMHSDNWKNAKWRFVLCHQVAYGCGWPGYNGETFLRNFLNDNAEKNKIDIVLHGHIHDYERMSKTYGNQKTHFFISGGAGGGLEPKENDHTYVMEKIIKKHHYLEFELRETSASVYCRDLKNNIMDSVNIENKNR